LLQKKMSSKSAGRVQSVTLKMICDNDAEIKAFVPARILDDRCRP
jgi:DNA topoisomerase-1